MADDIDLDFTCTIPHHEDSEARLKVSITNYRSEGDVMSVEDSNSKRISLTREEIASLAAIFDRYKKAKEIVNV